MPTLAHGPQGVRCCAASRGSVKHGPSSVAEWRRSPVTDRCRRATCDAVPWEKVRCRLLSAKHQCGNTIRFTEENQVRNSKVGRTYTLSVIAIFALSSTTMLWLLWRFPMGTALGALGVLLLFGIIAHLSRSSDTDIVPGFRSRPTA
jgi:hypothetical protein